MVALKGFEAVWAFRVAGGLEGFGAEGAAGVFEGLGAAGVFRGLGAEGAAQGLGLLWTFCRGLADSLVSYESQKYVIDYKFVDKD